MSLESLRLWLIEKLIGNRFVMANVRATGYWEPLAADAGGVVFGCEAGPLNDRWRGHEIARVGLTDRWVYTSDLQPVDADPNRPCGHCARPSTPEGHDGCLGTLSGVENACCGHGLVGDAYVQFSDPRKGVLRDEAALWVFRRAGVGPDNGKAVKE